MNRHMHSGVTLIELMVTIAVLAIFMSLAVPSFKSLIENNRLTTQANEFVNAVHFARTEAVKWRVQVSLRPTSTDCSTNGTSWTQGWIICGNTDRTGAVETLRKGAALAANFTMGGSTNLQFDYSGQLSGTAQRLVLCLRGAPQRKFTISPSGRIQSCKWSDSGCPELGLSCPSS